MKVAMNFSLVLVVLVMSDVLGKRSSVSSKRVKKTRRVVIDDNTKTNLPDGRLSFNLRNRNNTIYTAIAMVGNPPQELEVQFSTGSSITWLPTAGCISRDSRFGVCRTPDRLYHPKDSATARTDRIPYPTFNFWPSYSEDFVEVSSRRDTIRLGDLSTRELLDISDALIGAAGRELQFDYGMVSLTHRRDGTEEPFFYQAYKSGVFNRPLFTMHLRSCRGGCENGGNLVLGDHDTQHCDSKIHWTPVEKNVEMWRFMVDEFHINRKKWNIPKQQVTLSSTDAYICVSSEYLPFIHRAFKAKQISHNRANHTIVPCNSKISMKFKISGRPIVLTERELLIGPISVPAHPNHCIVAVTKAVNSGTKFVLGAPLLRARCLTHDTNSERIGFSRIKKH